MRIERHPLPCIESPVVVRWSNALVYIVMVGACVPALTGCTIQLWGDELCEVGLETLPTQTSDSETSTSKDTATPKDTSTPKDTGTPKDTSTTPTDTGKPSPTFEACTYEPLSKPKSCNGAEETDITSWLDVSVGEDFTCGVMQDGGDQFLECWGNDDQGQVSGGEAFNADYSISSVDAGSHHGCAATVHDTTEEAYFKCWGNNVSGQLGPGYYAGSEIALGQNHTCAVNDKGVVECDGANDAGQTSPPSEMLTGLSLGTTVSCGLQASGRPVCWGDERDPWELDDEYTAISVGSEQTCAIRADDATLDCWCNTAGFEEPDDLVGLGGRYADAAQREFLEVSMGHEFGCGVTTDNKVMCWGDNDSFCQLSDAPGGATLHNISTSLTGDHVCAQKDLSGPSEVVCWGRNDEGQSVSSD